MAFVPAGLRVKPMRVPLSWVVLVPSTATGVVVAATAAAALPVATAAAATTATLAPLAAAAGPPRLLCHFRPHPPSLPLLSSPFTIAIAVGWNVVCF